MPASRVHAVHRDEQQQQPGAQKPTKRLAGNAALSFSLPAGSRRPPRQEPNAVFAAHPISSRLRISRIDGSQTAQAEQLEMERKAQMQQSAKRSGRKLPAKLTRRSPPRGKHIDVQTEQHRGAYGQAHRGGRRRADRRLYGSAAAPIFIPMKTGVDGDSDLRG